MKWWMKFAPMKPAPPVTSTARGANTVVIVPPLPVLGLSIWFRPQKRTRSSLGCRSKRPDLAEGTDPHQVEIDEKLAVVGTVAVTEGHAPALPLVLQGKIVFQECP